MKHSYRTALLAGVMIGVTNFLTTIAVSLTNSADFHTSTLYALWSALGGLFSAVLCIGLQPLMEWMFNLTTSAKLLELSNPNQPLLRRMLLEAPGSYHHSIIVANLAETAATAIGANDADIARRADLAGSTPERLRAHGFAGTPAEVIDTLGALAELGIDRFYFQVMRMQDLDHIEFIGSEVLPQLR